MKRTLSLVAISVVAAMAAPIKFGADAGGLLTFTALDGDGAPDTKLGFGGKIAAAAEYGFSEQFSLRASAGYLFTTWGWDDNGNKNDLTSHFISLGADAAYSVVPKLQILAGLGVDIPVAGSYDAENTETYSEPNINPTTGAITYTEVTETFKSSGDIEDDNTVFLLEGGLGYGITEALSVNAKYRFPLTEYADQVKLSQVQVGISYNFANLGN